MGREETTELLRLAGLATPMALRVAVTLSLPDRLTGDSATAVRLAAELDLEFRLAHPS
ncbi:hypothetical protein [Amycolatopsis sp. cmx-8-4]|uniref:hypothetical protein n=1 Tax=Amycolatopsis sp. cmx-8-4 TaxID=2790947 RepID=UPI0039789636